MRVNQKSVFDRVPSVISIGEHKLNRSSATSKIAFTDEI